MKLLLICYECSPYVGSEWAVGWGRLLGAAAAAETHVLTSAANFEHLVRAAAEGLVPSNVSFYSPEPDARLLQLERKPGVYAYNYKAYKHWHRLAFTFAQRLHRQKQFDLVHQVNVCTFREPGFCADLGIPFLWGPFGGSQNFPAAFLSTLPMKEAVKEGMRTLANMLTLRSPRVKRAARGAACVIAANSTNQRDFTRAFGGKVGLLLETGLHAVSEPDRARYQERVERRRLGLEALPLRLLWSGELHTRKALPVLLRALARVPKECLWQLDVLGSGPMEAAWRDECARLKIQNHVHFHGRQAFADAVAKMQSADLFCFTSLRDTSGNVVLEALAAGVPVLCFDHQGAGDMVDETCGIKFDVRSPAKAYDGWSAAITTLASSPDALLALSHGATERAKKYLWSENHRQINDIYRELAGVPHANPSANVEFYAEAVEAQLR